MNLKKLKVARIIGGALGLLLTLNLVLVPAPVLAVEGIPHWFSGSVTIGTDVAPEGTIVSAQIGNVQYGDPTKGESYGTVDAAGRYGADPLFYVPADDPEEPGKDGGETGDIVEFYITNLAMGLDGVKANEFALFENFDVTELPLTLTIPDTTAPTVTITALTPDPTNVNTPTFTGTATDTESYIDSVEYSVDDGEWIPADAVDGAFDSLIEEYTFTTAVLLDGTYTVYVKATDAATLPNTTAEAEYASDEFVVDTEAPAVGISIEDYINLDNVTAVIMAIFSYEDGTYTYIISDGTDEITDTDTITAELAVVLYLDLSSLADGPITADASVEDAAGNVGAATPATATKDTTPPVIGVNAVFGRLSANGYDNPDEGLSGGFADYLDTFLGVNEQPQSLEIWAYAGDPDTAGVEKLQLTGHFDDITAIDYSMSYRDSVENNPGEDWPIYTNAELDTFFIALSTAENPKVVITVTDLAGNVATQTIPLVVAADTIPPTVVSTTPEADAPSVAINVVVSATFSEDIQAGDNFHNIAINEVAVNASTAGTTLTIAHDDFAYETGYTVTIPAGAVNDLAGNPLAEAKVWSFTTATEAVDATPPYTSGHDPAKGATGVLIDTNIVVHVLDDGDGVDIDTIAMTVEGASVTPVITGTPANYTLTYDPPTDFAYLQVVDVTVDASDLADNAMDTDSYFFTTTEAEVLIGIELVAGWNTFSTPIALDSCCDTWGKFSTISGILQDPAEIAYYFDSSQDPPWIQVTDVDSLEPLDGFYVYLLSEGTANIIPNPGITSPPTRVLLGGEDVLYLVGLASLEDMDVHFALGTWLHEVADGFPGYSGVISPGINYPDDWGYSRYCQDPYVYVPEDYMIRVGRAVWVAMLNDGTLVGWTETPIP